MADSTLTIKIVSQTGGNPPAKPSAPQAQAPGSHRGLHFLKLLIIFSNSPRKYIYDHEQDHFIAEGSVSVHCWTDKFILGSFIDFLLFLCFSNKVC